MTGEAAGSPVPLYTPRSILTRYPPWYIRGCVTHAIQEKQKLLNRIRRLRGQIDGIERALESEVECTEMMRQLTAVRGALNGIMAEVVEDHIQLHMVDPHRKPTRAETDAADQLIEVLKSYI